MGGLWIFGNGNNGTAEWMADPSNGRGTWTILSTCIITLSLSVYSALHLNIPAHKSSNAQIYGVKVKYVFYGLLAPELIVFNAWRQRTVAASIVAQLRKKRGGKEHRPLLHRTLWRLQKWPLKMLAAIGRRQARHIGRLMQNEKEVTPIKASRSPLVTFRSVEETTFQYHQRSVGQGRAYPWLLHCHGWIHA